MGEGWLLPDRLFDGQRLREGVGLRVAAGKVVEVGAAPASARRVRGTLTPGFVDLQVNGGGGVLLNTKPTRDGIATIAAAHRRFGTVAILPTVITDHRDVLAQSAEAVMAARDVPGVIGLHIEGPHISVSRKGTHASEHVRPMDAHTMEIVQRLRQKDVPVMITLAPEAVTAAEISALAEMGAVVSVGHTDATAEEVEAAMAAGAACATHLFNAMSPMLSRAPGAVGAVINSECFAGIICDGHHVADSMVGLALRARPRPDRMFLVSDAMASVGGPDAFTLYDAEVKLVDGQLLNTAGTLAGAHVTQAQGVARLVHHVGATLEDALRMAITVPADVMSCPELQTLVGRNASDVLLLDAACTLTATLEESLATVDSTD